MHQQDRKAAFETMQSLVPGTKKPTSFLRDYIAACEARPLDDDYIEQLLAHSEEGPIGEAAARSLLREVLRLRQQRVALERARTVLTNMAAERPGLWASIMGWRWPIHHEPLRADARNLLPVIDRALGVEAP